MFAKRLLSLWVEGWLVSDAQESVTSLGCLESLAASDTTCRCTITETGALNVTLCFLSHNLFALPSVFSWDDYMVSLIDGGGHLILWKECARATAMKLTGRFPQLLALRALLGDRTSRGALTENLSVEFLTRPTFKETRTGPMVDLIYTRSMGSRPSLFTPSIPDTAIIGGCFLN